jgi:protoheme IX farnesyltransferase
MTTAEYAYRAGIRYRSLFASIVLLSRPGILALVALAGFCGMVMAVGSLPDGRIAGLTIFCLLLSAAGSAMINSVLDYPLDIKMKRLQSRVDALRHLGRNRAMLLAGGLIIVSLMIAYRYLNALTALLALSAVLTYTVPYTLWLKRCSPFGAVPGGIPGALPVLVGYAAVAGAIQTRAMLLFLIVFLWQPPHFWIFALKHREDYIKSGVPVLPAVMGEKLTKSFILLHAAALLPASFALGFFGAFSIWYMGFAALSSVIFVVACYLCVVRDRSLGVAFRASIIYLLFLFLAIIIDICIFTIPAAGG